MARAKVAALGRTGPSARKAGKKAAVGKAAGAVGRKATVGRAARKVADKEAPVGKKPGKDRSFLDFVLDQLDGLAGVRAKGMFGGHGLYRDVFFFGIIFEGRLFFKVDDRTRPRYEDRGMKPFRPGPSQTLKRYYEVPLEVIEDAAELARWARDAAG